MYEFQIKDPVEPHPYEPAEWHSEWKRKPGKARKYLKNPDALAYTIYDPAKKIDCISNERANLYHHSAFATFLGEDFMTLTNKHGKMMTEPQRLRGVNTHWIRRYYEIWNLVRMLGGTRAKVGKCPSPTIKTALHGDYKNFCQYKLCPFCHMRKMVKSVFDKVKAATNAVPAGAEDEYCLAFARVENWLDLKTDFDYEDFNDRICKQDYKILQEIPGGRITFRPFGPPTPLLDHIDQNTWQDLRYLFWIRKEHREDARNAVAELCKRLQKLVIRKQVWSFVLST
ncbi:hypothetical protein Pla110_43840 [Polystyrenella longa]|uniref:Uncharacterized protein n=1 Tax=Polystyrenella longa TaxID=2528007 RepID=A0A518CTS5_9PLAN|nr:hypothetical protein [Polystyrenella longa]QDU82623.1 hypothetical protein Pla110_43840 [Polystyrenella longa]